MNTPVEILTETLDRKQPATKSPLRVAVVGCGAITRDFHLPVLAGCPGIVLAALVDRDRDAAARLAKLYQVPRVFADVADIDCREIDAALVATPPHHHAPCTIHLLRNGIHVLLEKPMALSGIDADAMVDAARESNRRLAIGVFRRLTPASRLMRAAIKTELLGRVIGFEVEEGHIFDWPSATLALMQKDLAGGGVLRDTGSHTLDQLFSFFDGPAELLDYRDNACGGIESDCMIRARIKQDGCDIEGSVELSRTRVLANRFRIQCERGVLELSTSERNVVRVQPDDCTMIDPRSRERSAYDLLASWEQKVSGDMYAPFRAQVDDWIEAIHGERQPYLSGASAATVVHFMDECYRRRQPLCEPWNDGLHATAVPKQPSREMKVLVTGASGFIGSRVAEILSLKYGIHVRAMVHRPGGASRVARLPVELVQADIRSALDVDRAVAGCSAVVHCAYGTEWGDRKALYDVTVGGTSALLAASATHGIQRFVHLSTVSVHGLPDVPLMNEETPVRPPRADYYAQTKARAERAVAQAAHRGLAAVILRPGHVYGPHSQPYTIRPALDILAGNPTLVGRGDSPSNTIYVDNLAEMIYSALTAPEQNVRGETFTAVDDDGCTWAQFFEPIASAANMDMHVISHEALQRLKTLEHGKSRIRRWRDDTIGLVSGTEAIEWAKRLLRSDPWGWPARKLLDASPYLMTRARKMVSGNQPEVYLTNNDAKRQPISTELFERYAYRAEMRSDKARKILHFAPSVSREIALRQTVHWLKYARILPAAD